MAGPRRGSVLPCNQEPPHVLSSGVGPLRRPQHDVRAGRLTQPRKAEVKVSAGSGPAKAVTQHVFWPLPQWLVAEHSCAGLCFI